MKNFKLGNLYCSLPFTTEYEIKSWKEVKHISKKLSESKDESVSVRLSSFSDLFERENTIKLNCERDAITVYLSCDLDFITNLFITDIVKADIRKVSLKKENKLVYKDHYQAEYILKKQQNGIKSYSFYTNDKELLQQFVEKVSVKALPSGKLDAPTNKKLVKLNRNALRKIKKNQF